MDVVVGPQKAKKGFPVWEESDLGVEKWMGVIHKAGEEKRPFSQGQRGLPRWC